MSDNPRDIINFRDVAEFLQPAGVPFRRGLLFRSGLLAWPDQEVIERYLGREGGLIVDLRSPNERQKVPAFPIAYPRSRLDHFASDMEEAAPHLFFPGAAVTRQAIKDYYISRYREMAVDPRFAAMMGRALITLARTSGPALVHCSAGKDRTGLFIAILLGAIGVPYAFVSRDYLASDAAPGLERSVRAALSRLGSTMPEADKTMLASALSRADQAYLNAAFAAIAEKYGSLDGYLAAIGVDDRARRNLTHRFIAPADCANA